MTRKHTGQSGSTGLAEPEHRSAVGTAVTAGPTPALVHQNARLVSTDDVLALSQRLLNLVSVCRSYSGTLGDEAADIRRAFLTLFA